MRRRRRPTSLEIYAPSPYWGTEAIWDSHTNMHNPMYDEKGRLWLTARIRPLPNPAFCKAGSDHPSAKVFPKDTSNRQTEVYDPKTQKVTMIDLCFTTHHLKFDEDGMLWFSAGAAYDVIGWLDVKKWDQTHDDAASQGWSPFVLDTNGNGKTRHRLVEPDEPIDPGKDKRIITGLYGINTSKPTAASGARSWASRAASCASIRRRSSASTTKCPGRIRRRRSKRLRAARHGHRQRRRRLGGARERSRCEL